MSKPLSDSHFRKALADWQPEPPVDAFPAILARQRRNRQWVWVRRYAAAAGVLLALGVGWLYWHPTDRMNQSLPLAQNETLPMPELRPKANVALADSVREDRAVADPPLKLIFFTNKAIPPADLQIAAQSSFAVDSVPTNPPLAMLASPRLGEGLPIKLPIPNVEPWVDKPSVEQASRYVQPARWLTHLQRVWKPAQALQVARVRQGEGDSEHLLVRCETPWFTFSHEAKSTRLAGDFPLSLLNPQ